MNCILKKEDFIFNKTSYLSFYECEINGFKLQINEEDFTEEELVFSGKLLDLYSENLTKIIDACVKSETFKYCYPDEDVHSIEEKLDEMSDLIKTMAGQINFIYNELVHIKK